MQIDHLGAGLAASVQAAGIPAGLIEAPGGCSWKGPWGWVVGSAWNGPGNGLGERHWGPPPRASRSPAAIQRQEGWKKLR
jgi:hypothetical protein